MSWRGVERSCGGIVAEVVLQVPVLIQLTHERDRLISGSKGPLDGGLYGLFAVRDPNFEFFRTSRKLEAKTRFSHEWCPRHKSVRQGVLRRRTERPRVSTSRLLSKLAAMASAAGLRSHIFFFFWFWLGERGNREANSKQKDS